MFVAFHPDLNLIFFMDLKNTAGMSDEKKCSKLKSFKTLVT